MASEFIWIHLREVGVSAMSVCWPADQSLYDVTNEMDSMRLSEVRSKLSRLVILLPYHSARDHSALDHHHMAYW